jgi:2-keto-4-pentenoate hydratase/2-oxohepta-3-ene-1,7-dioic acid hydratase in catechol pathway
MSLVSVLHEGRRRAAVLDGERVLVSDIDGGLDAAIAAGLAPEQIVGASVAAEAVQFDAPLRPPVVLCAGQNYRDHLAEKAPVEVSEPEFFLKAGQTIARPGEPCVLDASVTSKLDYETELAVVIGKGGRHIPVERADEHIFGYLVLNDITARDRQVVRRADGSFGLALGPGKNFDGATRLAQSVTPASAIDGPLDLRLTTWVDGELRQNNSTAGMLFSVPQILAYLSTLITLLPGTVIATGTPGGTGWGTDSELGGTSVTPPGCVPARYLSAGDEVVSRIEQVGELRFTVVADEGGRPGEPRPGA